MFTCIIVRHIGSVEFVSQRFPGRPVPITPSAGWPRCYCCMGPQLNILACAVKSWPPMMRKLKYNRRPSSAAGSTLPLLPSSYILLTRSLRPASPRPLCPLTATCIGPTLPPSPTTATPMSSWTCSKGSITARHLEVLPRCVATGGPTFKLGYIGLHLFSHIISCFVSIQSASRFISTSSASRRSYLPQKTVPQASAP